MDNKGSARVVKIPGQRLRRYADLIHKQHLRHTPSQPIEASEGGILRIVCIADTHNTQPELPEGDILIHAGDLTENGSFNEIQAQLRWLSQQPHRHKIVIAGNHDVLFDEEFLKRYPARRYGSSKTQNDLHWPDNLHFLNDSSVTLEVDLQILLQSSSTASRRNAAKRRIKVYGNPYTPQYGVSAFQYPKMNSEFWENKIPTDADIVVVHGPPRLHLDKTNVLNAGCPYLGEEIARVRPHLVVFGHIHVGYGREDVRYDKPRKLYEQIINFDSHEDGWNPSGWITLLQLAATLIWSLLYLSLLGRKWMPEGERVTRLVNAAVVGGSNNELKNQAVVVHL
ncbi:hypothetical protein DV736_g2978, partial [Chaetothyriales sp. CBS 134916]